MKIKSSFKHFSQKINPGIETVLTFEGSYLLSVSKSFGTCILVSSSQKKIHDEFLLYVTEKLSKGNRV